MNKLSFIATGDSFITRKLPNENEGFKTLSTLIKKADIRLTNLEVTIHNNEATPSAQSGGTWAMAPSNVLEDLKKYGFNLVSWANNHTLDYLYDGLECTKKYLEHYNFVHAGAGMNLAEADEPKYLETFNGRVALISVCSTFKPFNIAGDQRRDMKGRPGINPLRYDTIHTLSSEKILFLKEIANSLKINSVYELGVKQGVLNPLPQNMCLFSPFLKFKEDIEEKIITEPHKKDMERILKRISEAKRQADYVIVSMHGHEMKEDDKEQPADFLKIFAHKCIDGGADAIVGHGPHVLRGIEIYQNKPIFYSLGDFIFQNDTPSHFPQDFFERYGMGFDDNVADVLDKRSYNGLKGLGTVKEAYESVLPFWKVENGNLVELSLYPIELGFELPRYRSGWPRITDNENILKRLKELSKPFETEIIIENGIGKVLLNK
ncbi:CapA family protein [Bacillus pseudomycoides]|uniref:CapA family protein n=1 Tax=Bacillus pseudomycoides TaxID=64104 RepID=UPI000BF932B4|nr:CapA family protein [Bacillus pseudomycoides]PEP63510.1 capsule biosynthesis protein [Bacillus pseudomycoides]PHC96860.1 capsule biosynthesis protein [Bacillus pseudomycoides]